MISIPLLWGLVLRARGEGKEDRMREHTGPQVDGEGPDGSRPSLHASDDLARLEDAVGADAAGARDHGRDHADPGRDPPAGDGPAARRRRPARDSWQVGAVCSHVHHHGPNPTLVSPAAKSPYVAVSGTSAKEGSQFHEAVIATKSI